MKIEHSMSPNSFYIKKENDSFTSYLGMLIAIASFAMLFIALLASYGVLRTRAGLWMSYTIGDIPLWLSWINTSVIVISSSTYYKMSHFFSEGNDNKTQFWLGATFLIGIVFLAMQWYLWNLLISDGFTISAHQAGAVFYMLSGLHALHIMGGLILLIWLFHKIKKSTTNHNSVKIVGLFWHFLTLVWITIFITVILL